jgi:hypothetical protein
LIASAAGAFAVTSPGTYAIADLISSVFTNENGSLFAGKPFEARGILTYQLYSSLRLVEHLGCANYLADRHQYLADPPSPTRQGQDDHHHLKPGDESAFE